ncbi:MAG: hypothetical protein OXI90_07865 [Gammaproteobacteria bacterium]|nr:hypothetical protein [Gammaproteobacteria bacterium]
MLDSPFESAAVRRHKDREVDKLLIVSAPRERVVLVCLVLFVLAVAALVAVGSVERTISLDGVVYRAAPDQPGRVALRVAPTLGQSIRPGIAATIEVAAPAGATLQFEGKTAAPMATALPEEIAAHLPWPADGARRIDVAIADTGDVLAIPEGSMCRVQISLGRQSIASVLAFTPP